MAEDKKSVGTQIKEAFKSQPIILQIVEILIVIIIIWRAVNGIWSWFKTKQENAAIDGEQAAFTQAGQKLTYPISNYKIFADQIDEAMQAMGTYPDVIEGIFMKMNNDLDILELNKAFGHRDIYFFGFAYNFSLPEALADEMDVSGINKILEQKNIQYRY